MLGVAEADLQLEGDFPCERRPRHAQIARRACRRERSAFRGFTMARGRVARGPGAPSSPQTGDREGSNPSPSSSESATNPSSHRSQAVRHRFKRRRGIDGRPKKFGGVPMVRIHLPPADSQSLSRSRFRRSRTPLFRAGLGSWLGDRVSRDAPGFALRANRRQYLCRAIFQYRSADEVVSENAAPVPTKLGLLRGERAWILNSDRA